MLLNMLHYLLVVAVTWLVLSFMDLIFKSCMFPPYVNNLEKRGITFKPLFFKLFTTKFNQFFIKCGHSKPHFLRKWFNIGVMVTCILLPVSVYVLILSIIQTYLAQSGNEQVTPILQPMIPGLNIPVSNIFYCLITFFAVSMFHEFGHAVAAVREGVGVDGCGFFVICTAVGAFVYLPKEKMSYLSHWQQLRVYCAGVWHNVILACFATFLLVSNTVLFSPLFKQNSGITVIDVAESGVSGIAGLHSGDLIYSIDSCLVNNPESWKECLKDVSLNPQRGYCVTEPLLISKSYKILDPVELQDCCKNSSNKLCFEYTNQTSKSRELSCLPVREIIDAAVPCTDKLKVENMNVIYLAPVLELSDHRLIVIKREHKNSVLFLGPATELFSSVTISSWVPRFRLASVHLLHIYETLLKYIISFSAAVGLLNVVPCPGLDGHFLCQILVDSLLFNIVPRKSHRKYISDSLQLIGLILIIFVGFSGISNPLLKHMSGLLYSKPVI